MSYILDALKKADKERKRGSVPDLSTVQDLPQKKQKKHSLWPYLVVFALLINAGIFLFWSRPWETDDKTTVAKAPPPVTHDLQATASLPESVDRLSPRTTVSSKPVESAPPGTTAPQENSSRNLHSTMSSGKPESRKQQQQPIPTPTHAVQEDVSAEEQSQSHPPEPTAPSSTTTLPPNTGTTTVDQQRSLPQKPSGSFSRLYDFKDIPPSVKDKLPDIAISVFVYSDDPSSRIVKINGQTIREGQELADGLTVEKIVPEGVIFHYEDYRFRVRIR